MHILVGLVIVILYYYDILSPLAVFLAIIVGVLASVLSKRVKLPVFSFFLKHFEREEVKKTFPGKGMIYYFVGALLVMKLFDKDIALAAIMVLALGDSVSHIVGERFGQIQNIFNWKGHKLLEGTLAGILAGFLGAMLFVSPAKALVGSFAAMVAEVVEIDLNKNTLDDNLIVPLAAGTAIFLLKMYV